MCSEVNTFLTCMSGHTGDLSVKFHTPSLVLVLLPVFVRSSCQSIHVVLKARLEPFCLSACSADNYGRQFAVMVLETLSRSVALNLFAVTPGNAPVQVSVTAPSWSGAWTGEQLTLEPGKASRITIPTSLINAGNQISSRGILIQASADIALFSFNSEDNSCGGALIIPVDALGTQYHAVSGDPRNLNQQEFSHLGVVAPFDATDVTFTFPERSRIAFFFNGQLFGANRPLTIRLSYMEVFSLSERNNIDLTGTRIASSRTVAVFSGNPYVSIAYSGNQDATLSQLSPVSTWGTDYILAPFPGRSVGDRVRIIARDPQTSVTSTSGNLNQLIDRAGGFLDLDMSSDEAMRLTSNKPIYVAQLAKSTSGGDTGEPVMLAVPPISQFRNEHTFAVPNIGEYNIFLTLFSEQASVSSVVLDGNPVSNTGWRAIPGSPQSYVYKTIQISPGHHSVFNTQSGAVVGATVYGQGGRNCGFAYPVGSCFENSGIVSSSHSLRFDVPWLA